METIQRPVSIIRTVGAGILIATAAMFVSLAGEAVAEELCPSPGTDRTVIASLEDWRTLVTRDGERLTPAGIADFGVIAPDPTDGGLSAEKALADALRRYAGRQLGIVYLSKQADRRGRRPVLLYAGETLLQQDLVGSGLAIAYPLDGEPPCVGRLLGAEDNARAARRGYWAQGENWIAGPRPDDFAGRLNRFVILQARVISVGTREDRSYLNFGGRWSEDVTVEIPDAGRDAFGGSEALEALAGLQIRVRGFAVEKSGPMIEARRPWQIEVLTNRGR